MSGNDSDTRSTAYSPQWKTKATNSDAKNLNTSVNKHLVEKSDKETINNLKNLDRNETFKRLNNIIFNHEANISDALLIHRTTLSMQRLNEDSNENKIKNNAEENKECEDDKSTPNVQ